LNYEEAKKLSPILLTPRHEELAKSALNAALKVHMELGPGLLINFNTKLLKDGTKRVPHPAIMKNAPVFVS